MATFQQWSSTLQKVGDVLKARFPNLTVSETITLASEIVQIVITETAPPSAEEPPCPRRV